MNVLTSIHPVVAFESIPGNKDNPLPNVDNINMMTYNTHIVSIIPTVTGL